LIYLIGSVLLSSYLTLSFKVIERLKISSFQAVVFNYLTCAILGSIISSSFIFKDSLNKPWFTWAILVGFTFVTLLNIIAITAQKISVAVASVANKLSLVIPFIFSIFLYNEKATILKIAGVVLALAGVLLTSLPGKNKKASSASSISPVLKFILPAVLFIGSGLLDTMMKYVQTKYLKGDENEYSATLFSTAAIIALIILPFYLKIKRERFDIRSIPAGVLIGVPNYFSIWFLLRVLKKFNNNSTAIIPINNMGIVLVSSIAAWFIFKEHISFINWIGIIVSLGAIALIAFG
jgi:drug/metabolite transporter (DMT)-like permease